MTPEVFREATNVSRETLDRLRVYADCLTRWQSRINLVARDSLSDLWGRHMLDSAQLVPHISGGSGTVTDLGSGAGFPGLVISIITGQEARLIEADERKAAFLREAIRLTEAPATVHNVRIEAIEPWPTRFITARALAPLVQPAAPPGHDAATEGSISPVWRGRRFVAETPLPRGG